MIFVIRCHLNIILKEANVYIIVGISDNVMVNNKSMHIMGNKLMDHGNEFSEKEQSQ